MIKPGMKAPPKNKRGGSALQRKKPVSMLKGGGSMKPVPKENKGLAKLPTKVRNRMGYAKGGGKLKMVEKDGKKVPFFAADGVGKMKEGGSTNQKKVDKVIKGLKKASKLHSGQAKSLGTLKMVRGGSFKIKAGDTLSDIAKQQGTTVKAIVAANPSIKNANMIRAGQTIKIPSNTRTRNPYRGMTSKEITSGKMATRKRKPAPKKAAKKANPKQPQKKSVFGRIKKMLGMKKTGGTVRK